MKRPRSLPSCRSRAAQPSSPAGRREAAGQPDLGDQAALELLGLDLPVAGLRPDVPARWAFAAGAATIGVPTGAPRSLYAQHDALWDHTAGTWLLDLGGLVVLAALYVAVAWWLLRRLDPRRR